MKKTKNMYLGIFVSLALLALFSSCDSTTLMWFHPQSYSEAINPAGTTAVYPDIAINSKGDAISVWSQNDGSNSLIYKREYRDGSWGDMPILSSDAFSSTGQDSAAPGVAMDDSGDAIVVWLQSDGSNTLLYEREYRDGQWSSVPDLTTGEFSSDGQSLGVFPSVAMSNNGDAVVAWVQNNGSNSLVYIREYRNGSWSSKPDLLTGNFSDTGESAGQVEVAMDDDGNAIVVWMQSNGTDQTVYMREYRNGTWSSKPSLLTGNFSVTGYDASLPRVAMDNKGNAIVTYIQENTSGDTMVYKREYRNGAWSSIPSVDSDNISPTGQSASLVAVAMSDKGNAIITWGQSDGSYNLMFKSEYVDGSWSNPVDLSDNFGPKLASLFYWPEIAMNSKGDAIITYQMTVGAVFSLLVSEYNDGIWTHPETIRDSITPNEGPVQNLMPGFASPVVMNNKGQAAITWVGMDNLTVPSIFVSLKK